MAKIIKGEKRGRPGVFMVDFRDHAGVRRNRTFGTKREAEDFLTTVLREHRNTTRPSVDPQITFAEYAEQWLRLVKPSLKQRSGEVYEQRLSGHVVPAFGPLKVRQIDRGRVKRFLAEKATTHSGTTVRALRILLGAILDAAEDDGIIINNPARRLPKQFRFSVNKRAQQEQVKAFTREQARTFVAACPGLFDHTYFLTGFRTGLRTGELIGLQWDDLDLHGGRTARIERAVSDDGSRVDTPKSGFGRTIDLTPQLCEALKHWKVELQKRALASGEPLVPWVFPYQTGQGSRRPGYSGYVIPETMRGRFDRILKQADLPRHFHPHCMRHTYATLLLADGVSPVYVQQQLGHASISITVDRYGKWIRVTEQAADRLDDQTVSSGIKTPAAQA